MDTFEFRRGLIRAFGDFHAWAYEKTGGRWGGRLKGLPMALLYLIGRKSGALRPTPLLYMKDGEDLVIVASFYGSPKHPAWYYNVLANPAFEVRVDRRRYRVRAREATPAEREKLWPRLVEHYPGYAAYQARTEREIPVLILSPIAEA